MKLIKNKEDSVRVRSNLKTFYLNKYYNLFMNAYLFSEEIDYQQKDYILKQFWATGQIACFKLKGTEGSSKHPQGLLVFTPFAPNGWNIYDWPISVTLINTKGVKFIPTGIQELDKDCVIGFAQRNKKPVKFMIEEKINQIVDTEMVIRCNLNSHKMPWLFASTPEMENKMKVIADALRSDDPEIFVSGEEADMMKALVSGSPFIIDKLYNYKCAIENEIKEFLGINNLGVNEKKEHLVTSEVDVNNEVIEAYSDCFLDNIKEFFERVSKVTGINVEVKLNKPQEMDVEEETTKEEEIQDDEI